MNPNEINVNLEQGLIYSNSLKPDINKYVWDYQGGFNRLNFIASRGAGLRRADANNGRVEDFLFDLPVVQALIASVVTISATQLQINFVSTTLGFVTTGNITNNFALNTRARVIYVDPNNNYIIIESLDDAQVLSSGDWADNTWITQEYNTQPRVNNGIPSTYYTPSKTYNNCTIMRKTLNLNLEDDVMTWTTAQNGDKYWIYAQEELTLQDLERYDEMNSLKGTLGFWSPDQTPSNGGVVWAIKDELRGGEWSPYFSPPSLEDFTSWLDSMANRNNKDMSYISLGVGRGALEMFQNWTSNYIQYAGIFNTFGGQAVEGIDVNRWQYGGISAQLFQLPSLNSQDFFRNQSSIVNGSVEYNTMIGLDIEQMETVASSTHQMPLQRLTRGSRELVYKIMPGVHDDDFMDKAMGVLAVTDSNSMTIQMMKRGGINYIARNGGLFQPGA